MVFTERTGLENLYSIVSYCIDKKLCKRQLIAQHFRDQLWSKTGQCHQMCDICNRAQDQDPSIEKLLEMNCLSEAEIVLKILDKHSGKDKRLTANKLAELSSTEIKKSKDSVNKLSREQTEQLIIELLLNQYLREEFSYTPYSTICYLVKAERMPPRESFNIFLLAAATQNNANEIKVVKKTLIKKKVVKELANKCDIIIETSSDTVSNKRKSNNEIVILTDSDDDDNEVCYITKKNKN